jgi:hypothetical protein
MNAKRCMYPGIGIFNCSYGVPDILYRGPDDTMYVWEVKSVGPEAKEALPEARWYVNRLEAMGHKAALGETFGVAYYGPAYGNMEVGVVPGTAILWASRQGPSHPTTTGAESGPTGGATADYRSSNPAPRCAEYGAGADASRARPVPCAAT